MSSKNWLNISLLAILALLLTITFWPGEEPAPAKATTVAGPLDSASINTITVTRRGHPGIVLHKKDQQWWLQQPALPAKAHLISELLALLESESLIKYPLNEIEAGPIGLENPFLCIEYNQQRACFGARNPLNQLRYLQFGDQIHMIYDTLSHQLSGEAHDYVSLKLLPDDAQITALTLEDDLMLKKSDGIWHLTPPPENYSADQTQQLINNWQQTQALVVAPYQPTDSEATLQLALEKQGTIAFELISSDPELILARPELGIQYHLSEGSLSRLTRLPALEIESE
ncbi:hypothetical protein MNBD_GAMMA18-358 [hydrothermal vent metagenome]|uniref:DUF4340 domain-containing protein n=1 Tax=hydrothermal vent metagenome TaxID=652676 RepID=A0A3B0ZGY1_9ZZZZ